MNLQRRHSPKVGRVLDIVGRVMTRNQKNKVTRNADRLQFLKNFQSIGDDPGAHLAYALQIMDNYSQLKQEPTFEMGLMLGMAVTFAASHMDTTDMLRRIYAEIAHQQDGDPDQPTPAVQPLTPGEDHETG